VGCRWAEAAGDLAQQQLGLGLLGAFLATFGEDLLIFVGGRSVVSVVASV